MKKPRKGLSRTEFIVLIVKLCVMFFAISMNIAIITSEYGPKGPGIAFCSIIAMVCFLSALKTLFLGRDDDEK